MDPTHATKKKEAWNKKSTNYLVQESETAHVRTMVGCMQQERPYPWGATMITLLLRT